MKSLGPETKRLLGGRHGMVFGHIQPSLLVTCATTITTPVVSPQMSVSCTNNSPPLTTTPSSPPLQSTMLMAGAQLKTGLLKLVTRQKPVFYSPIIQWWTVQIIKF